MTKFTHAVAKAALAGVSAVSLVGAVPAMAATFIDVGDQAYITFGGTQPDTSANLLLTLTAENNANSIFTFSYVLTNTSSLVTNPTSRIPGFGFNDNVAGAATGSATGDFTFVDFGTNFPDGLGNREICVNAQNCLGGNSGATVGDPATGTFTIDYATGGLTQVSLSNFAVHYISVGANGRLSGTGTGTEEEIPDPQGGVPEPSTWAMMLLGFGAIGFAMRRRRAVPQQVRFSFS